MKCLPIAGTPTGDQFCVPVFPSKYPDSGPGLGGVLFHYPPQKPTTGVESAPPPRGVGTGVGTGGKGGANFLKKKPDWGTLAFVALCPPLIAFSNGSVCIIIGGCQPIGKENTPMAMMQTEHTGCGGSVERQGYSRQTA